MPQKRRRDTPQQQQERISRAQFQEFINSLGWFADDIQDMGEDILVRIWENGSWTGMSFYVQLKSTADISRNTIRGDLVSYKFEVKDLIHWRHAANPVYLLIWDIDLREGCWIGVDDALKELDRRRPDWRRKKSVRVRMTLSNKTDRDSFSQLRYNLAQYYLPSVAEGKKLEISTKFSFEPDSEGKSAIDALQRFIATGEKVTISGKYINQFEISDWWTRLFGRIDVSKGDLTMGPSRSNVVIPINLRMISHSGVDVVLPYIELREVQKGDNEATLTNDEQVYPLRLEYILRRSKKLLTLNLKLRSPGEDICLANKVLQFMAAFAQGGKLQLTDLSRDQDFEFEVPSGQATIPERWLIDIIVKLCVIAKMTSSMFTLNTEWHIDTESAYKIIDVLATRQFVRGEKS